MQQLFVDERLEYLGMYNWTNDLPRNINARQDFLDVLNYLNEKNKEKNVINILEIGTYTGVSLIKILENVPKGKASCIDRWITYDECDLLKNVNFNHVKSAFFENVRKANMNDQIINVYNGDSCDVLIELVKEKTKYDFIYVDGSHRLLDVYLDLVLSFELLEDGGILGIDDTTYKKEEILESPFEAVLHFLNKYQTRYRFLKNSYRVFIEKIN